MKHLILYHGSTDVIEHPEYNKGKAHNDYGRGFYCTQSLELAKEWACAGGELGYANEYTLDTDSLAVLNLADEKYSVLNWLVVLVENRGGRFTTPIAELGVKYLAEQFLPEYKEYDVIVGYRADDSYFAYARAFVNNEISLRQLSYAIKLGDLGLQVVLKTPKAFQALRYSSSLEADPEVYYPKRKARDDKAREQYRQERIAVDIDGIFMRDILRGEMKPDDPRLF